MEKEIMIGNVRVTVVRPALTDEERKTREENIRTALTAFGEYIGR